MTIIAISAFCAIVPSRAFGQDAKMVEECMANHTAWSRESCERYLGSVTDPKILQCLRANPGWLAEDCANWEAPKPKRKKAAAALAAAPTPANPPRKDYAETHPIETAITNTVLVMLGGALALAIYFAPGITASRRKHRQAGAIWTLNFALGWTLIGWVVALVWANTVPDPPQIVVVQPGQAIPGIDLDRVPEPPAKLN